MIKVSVISQHQFNPREGKLNALYRMFWWLKCDMSHSKNPNVVILLYDSLQTEVDDRLFPQSDQDQWNCFFLILRSYYHQICLKQYFYP